MSHGNRGDAPLALAKIIMRVSGEQKKTACVNIQQCAGLEYGIEGTTHSVRQRQKKMTKTRGGEEAVEEAEEEEDKKREGLI